MKQRMTMAALGSTFLAGIALMPACTVMGVEGEGELEDIEAGGGVSEGAQLFNKETFGGNGRRCQDCHPSESGETGTLSPADVEARFQANPNDPLFMHDAADVIGGNTFDRIRQHATILVEMPLPPNVSIKGSSARSVVVPRGIPHTLDTATIESLFQVDGRFPSLQIQARAAIAGHAQSTNVTEKQLDALADYQATLFSRDNIRDFAKKGTPLALPYGTTESEQRGRRFFIADGQTDPELVGESPQQICGWCHSGQGLNELSGFFVQNVAPFPFPEGFRFSTVLVSDLNTMGNPVYEFEFAMPDGSVVTIPSPDPGVALLTGDPFLANIFKITTMWGAADTAPYFHDNSAKDLGELMDHYDLALFLLTSNNPDAPPIDLTEQQKADIEAYLRLL